MRWFLVFGTLFAMMDIPSVFAEGPSSDVTTSAPSSSGPTSEEIQAASKAVPRRVFTKDEIQKACRQNAGKFIVVYSQVYWVSPSCERHAVSAKEIYEKQVLPTTVDNSVIAMIPEGMPYEEKSQKPFDCRRLDKQYFVYQMDYYWLSGCRLRRFPDLATWEDHRRKNDGLSKVIQSLSDKEFASIAREKEFSSVITPPSLASKAIEILPIEEACRSLVGSYVSYFDKIYLIVPFSNPKKKGCYKKAVDAVAFSREMVVKGVNIKTELNSDQAISIPEYDPS